MPAASTRCQCQESRRRKSIRIFRSPGTAVPGSLLNSLLKAKSPGEGIPWASSWTMPLDRPAADDVPDVRMYVPESAGWNVHIKRDSQKQYCYQKRSGEDFFHLIQAGEIYLVNEAEEKLCLMCALSRGVVTRDRLFWQH